MTHFKSIFIVFSLFLAQTSLAELNCPNLEDVQSAPMVQVVAACEDGSEDCGDYAVISLLRHNGQYWAAVSGLFDETDTFTQAEKLIAKAHAPEIISEQGQQICLYYGITEEEGRYKAVGAVPYDELTTQTLLRTK